MRKPLVFTVAVCVVLAGMTAWGGTDQKQAEGRVGGWWFQAGPVYRGGMHLDVEESTYVQDMGLHAAQPYGQRGWGVGPVDEYANRDYADGYVNIDLLTFVDGRTWFWGYEHNSQYRAQNGTLRFHKDVYDNMLSGFEVPVPTSPPPAPYEQNENGAPLLITIPNVVTIDPSGCSAGVEIGKRL